VKCVCVCVFGRRSVGARVPDVATSEHVCNFVAVNTGALQENTEALVTQRDALSSVICNL